MKYIFASFILLCTNLTLAQQKNFLDQPYLETSATVDTLVVPDKIYLNIYLSEKDTKDRTSVEELENQMKSVLVSLGIDIEEQLQLADLSSNFKDYFLRKTGVIKSKAFVLLVYDALSAGKVIQGLESKEIANVGFQRAEVSNMDQIRMSLNGKAVAEARKKAEIMLAPLGQQLGKALYVADQNMGINYGYQRDVLQEMVVSKADMSQPIDVDFQNIKVSTTVNIKFAIQ